MTILCFSKPYFNASLSTALSTLLTYFIATLDQNPKGSVDK